MARLASSCGWIIPTNDNEANLGGQDFSIQVEKLPRARLGGVIPIHLLVRAITENMKTDPW